MLRRSLETTPGISCEAVPASDRAGAGMRRHLAPRNRCRRKLRQLHPLVRQPPTHSPTQALARHAFSDVAPRPRPHRGHVHRRTAACPDGLPSDRRCLGKLDDCSLLARASAVERLATRESRHDRPADQVKLGSPVCQGPAPKRRAPTGVRRNWRCPTLPHRPGRRGRGERRTQFWKGQTAVVRQIDLDGHSTTMRTAARPQSADRHQKPLEQLSAMRSRVCRFSRRSHSPQVGRTPRISCEAVGPVPRPRAHAAAPCVGVPGAAASLVSFMRLFGRLAAHRGRTLGARQRSRTGTPYRHSSRSAQMRSWAQCS